MSKRTDYFREYMKNRYRSRKEKAISLLGGKCTQCGSNQNLRIQYKEEKKLSVLENLRDVSETKLTNELEKCHLICTKCIPKLFEHGTLSAYRHCGPPKCDLCRKAKNEYMRNYKKNRKQQVAPVPQE